MDNASSSTAENFMKRDEQSIQVLKTRRAASAAAIFDLPTPTTSSPSSSSSPIAPLTPSNSTSTGLEHFGSKVHCCISPSRPKSFSHKRPPLKTLPSQLSTISNTNMSISGYERASMSTLWSSADIPVFLDSEMVAKDAEPIASEILMRTPKGTLTCLPATTTSDEWRDKLEELDEPDTSKDSMDGPRTVSSPPTSDDLSIDDSIVSFCTRKQRGISAVKSPQFITTPTKMIRHSAAVPQSVSESTMSTLKSSPNLDIKTARAAPLPPKAAAARPVPKLMRQVTPPDLYIQADKFFSKSYTMLSNSSSSSAQTKTPSPLIGNLPELPPHIVAAPSPGPESKVDLSSRFSDHSPETEEPAPFRPPSTNATTTSDGIVFSPSFSLSRDSRSSAESSALPEIDDAAARIASRVLSFSPRSPGQVIISNGRKSNEDAEILKYGFLQSPAPLPSRKLSASFGSRSRTTSNVAKFAADEPAFEMINTMTTGNIRDLRLRAKTLGDYDRPEVTQINAGIRRPSRTGIEIPSQRSRRPSSNEEAASNVDEIDAERAHLHRPSNTETISGSSFGNSSFTSLNNLSEVCSRPSRLPSTASSQIHPEPLRTKRANSNSVPRPKSKGGCNWASHLSQGISLYIEQGSKKYSIKMNYLSYDPFGKPETLCLDRPMTPSRPRSKCGNYLPDGEVEEASVGLLEFAASSESIATTHLVFQSSPAEAPVLKHLVIGDDTKADLISRQADLSMCNIGTREVSGSERKGKMTWRFIYGVEECRFESGQACEGIKTLRPLSFFCSATLLDPSKAKKARMLNILRKQMGTHIESMPMIGSSSSSSCVSATSTTHSRNASPQVQNARLDVTSTTLPSTTAANAPVGQQSNSSTFRRPSLIPFKMTRPMMEAVNIQNRNDSSASSNLIISAPMPLISEGQSLASPSSSEHSKNGRSGSVPVSLHPAGLTRPRGSSVGQYRTPTMTVTSNLSIDPNRLRAASDSKSSEVKRPQTASEEIKQAYLQRSDFSTSNSHEVSQQQYSQYRAGSVPAHNYNALQMSNMQQSLPSSPTSIRISTSTSHANLRRPSNFTLSDARMHPSRGQQQVPTSPLAIRRHITMSNNTPKSNRYDATEGASWL